MFIYLEIGKKWFNFLKKMNIQKITSLLHRIIATRICHVCPVQFSLFSAFLRNQVFQFLGTVLNVQVQSVFLSIYDSPGWP